MRPTTPLCALLLFLLAGCGALATPDAPATLRAQNAAFVLEATAIRDTLVAREAEVRATAFAAETQVIQRNSINSQLLATVVESFPPTQQQVVINPVGTYFRPFDAAAELPSAPSPAPGETPLPGDGQGGAFVDTVTARALRQSDGCAQGAVTSFTLADDRIYVVTRATRVRAGTQIAVEWQLDGAPVDQTSWTVPSDEENFCIWFYLDSFSPGSWSVQLSADGTPISPAPAFTVTE